MRRYLGMYGASARATSEHLSLPLTSKRLENYITIHRALLESWKMKMRIKQGSCRLSQAEFGVTTTNLIHMDSEFLDQVSMQSLQAVSANLSLKGAMG